MEEGHADRTSWCKDAGPDTLNSKEPWYSPKLTTPPKSCGHLQSSRRKAGRGPQCLGHRANPGHQSLQGSAEPRVTQGISTPLSQPVRECFSVRAARTEGNSLSWALSHFARNYPGLRVTLEQGEPWSPLTCHPQTHTVATLISWAANPPTVL